MKSKTEVALWLLFFLIIAAFGFLQGWKPDLHLTEYVSKPTPIQILSISPVFFPQGMILEIEKGTRTKIQIKPIQNWEDLRLQLISDSHVSLLFLPLSWIRALEQENLLHESQRFEDLKSELTSADFNFVKEDQRQDFLPIFWAQLSFYFEQSGQKTLNFPDDAGLYLDAQSRIPKDPNFSKLKISILKWNTWWEDPKVDADLFLAPHPAASRHSEWKLDTSKPSWLGVWGFALPKNAELGNAPTAFLRAYTDPARQTELLKRLPLASTLTSMDEKAGPIEKKALYLRDLKMSLLNLIPRYDANSIETLQRQAPGLHFSR